MGCCGRKWPRNNRLLRKIVQRNAGNFWDNVMYSKKICLRRFQLPHCDSVTFSYVDPLFVWIQHANLLHNARHELRWRPKSLHHPQSHERVYGAGVQYGLLLEKACHDVPGADKVALINLSWDGLESKLVVDWKTDSKVCEHGKHPVGAAVDSDDAAVLSPRTK